MDDAHSNLRMRKDADVDSDWQVLERCIYDIQDGTYLLTTMSMSEIAASSLLLLVS